MAVVDFRILPCGDAAAIVEFGDVVDLDLNRRVLALDEILRSRDEVREAVPTYRSLLVHYDPLRTSFADMSRLLAEAAGDLTGEGVTGRIWRVPVAYGGQYGIDLEATAALHAITPAELVRRHAAPDYPVYMIGFMPGYAYLGGLDPTIATPRRVDPRLRTPAGTISIGGIQALVASIEAPSGWHLLGRTPMRNYMPERDPVVLLRPGDTVRFHPIDPESFDELDRKAAAGEPVAEIVAS